MRIVSKLLATAVASGVLTACGTQPTSFGSPLLAPLLSTGHATTSGSHQFFDEQSFERIDLVTLLDPERRRETHLSDGARLPAVHASGSAGPLSIPDQSVELERAFRAFYSYAGSLEDRRSRLQDRIVAASDQRCNTYKNYLRRIETTQQSWLGSLTTILGGAGAISTHTATVRAFSGLAGISSGVGAELRQSYFSNLATQVIVPGIELARQDLRREMLSKRNQAASVYTVEAAIADVSRYHGACSMNAGIERSGKAVNEVSNPGVRSLNATLGQLNLAQKLAKRLTDETVEITERDIRFADGVTLSATPQQAMGAQLLNGIGGRQTYLDRYSQSLRSLTDSLGTLKTLIAARLQACKAAEADRTSAACKAAVDYGESVEDQGSEVNIDGLVKSVQEKMAKGASTELGAVDTRIRKLELQLLDQEDKDGETPARYALRKELLGAETTLSASAELVDTAAIQLSKARSGVLENDAQKVKAALKSFKETIIAIK